MYPRHYFSLFPSAPIEPQVFVAMAFDKRHRPRWESVIRPAIEDIELRPHRVDVRRVSDSILTEILQGIGASKLIFAEVSPLDEVRNTNVMYELGIAHAAREPTEVVIFRDDNAPLPFDVANVRVNRYEANPDDNPEQARESVRAALADALRELDLSKSMAVQMSMQRLDQTSFNLLISAVGIGSISHPEQRTRGQILASADTLQSLRILLELGLVRPKYPDLYSMAQNIGEPELAEPGPLPVIYAPTELGKAVMVEIALRNGGIQMINDAELAARMTKRFEEMQPELAARIKQRFEEMQPE